MRTFILSEISFKIGATACKKCTKRDSRVEKKNNEMTSSVRDQTVFHNICIVAPVSTRE